MVRPRAESPGIPGHSTYGLNRSDTETSRPLRGQDRGKLNGDAGERCYSHRFIVPQSPPPVASGPPAFKPSRKQIRDRFQAPSVRKATAGWLSRLRDAGKLFSPAMPEPIRGEEPDRASPASRR